MTSLHFARRTVCLVFIIATLILSTGCATLTRGNKQKVKLVTDPTMAQMVVDGKAYVSPTEVVVVRKKQHVVTVQKDGYQGITFILKSKWDAGGVGAVAVDAAVPGGSALFIIDTLYGADREFSKIITIKLPPATQPSPPVLTLYEYKGKLLNKPDYDAAVEHDKLFKNKKKQPTTRPANSK